MGLSDNIWSIATISREKGDIFAGDIDQKNVCLLAFIKPMSSSLWLRGFRLGEFTSRLSELK